MYTVVTSTAEFSSARRFVNFRPFFSIPKMFDAPRNLPCCLIILFYSLIKLISASKSGTNFVTCGSVVKLANAYDPIRLHSHDVKYGSGSGQQSVTGVEDTDDHNSHWAVMGMNETACFRGQPIKCDDHIRLRHSSTGCFLHSHLFDSPLSGNQEVSCFGNGRESDTGDFWAVQCPDGADVWLRTADVRFKHKDTGSFLGVSGRSYGRPISGQREICAFNSPSGRKTSWTTKEGVYISPSSPTTSDYPRASRRDEL